MLSKIICTRMKLIQKSSLLSYGHKFKYGIFLVIDTIRSQYTLIQDSFEPRNSAEFRKEVYSSRMRKHRIMFLHT